MEFGFIEKGFSVDYFLKFEDECSLSNTGFWQDQGSVLWEDELCCAGPRLWSKKHYRANFPIQCCSRYWQWVEGGSVSSGLYKITKRRVLSLLVFSFKLNEKKEKRKICVKCKSLLSVSKKISSFEIFLF